MDSARSRRHQRLTRLIAKVAPVFAAILLGLAVVLGGPWPVVAAAGAAVITTVVAVLVLRMDRWRRLEVASTRARVAADYAAEHKRYASEHRTFTNHLVELLDAASSRIGLLRHRIGWLEAELSSERSAKADRAAPGTELVRAADVAQPPDMWPDFTDAPTVVDLAVRDDRANRADEADQDEQGNRVERNLTADLADRRHRDDSDDWRDQDSEQLLSLDDEDDLIEPEARSA